MIDLRSRKAAAMVVVVDFLLAVLLMQQAVLSLTTINKSKTPPRIETTGTYLVKVTWPQNTDVDLYIQDPNGENLYFMSREAGQMHLERDDLGNEQSSHKNQPHQERGILRGTEVGEYIVNVHLYSKREIAEDTVVTIEFWQLRGRDRVVLTKKIKLSEVGQEETIFRFVLNENRDIESTNDLEKKLVGGGGFFAGGDSGAYYGGGGPPS